MMTMDSQALVKLGGAGIPETLGNFRLDDHNVVEWSDSDLPGVRHKGRKETGKWINPVNNADIQYQKQEDCKKSDRGQEQVRTEVIQGQAPDSQFQIVRSHTHYTGSDKDKFNSLVQSSSTSYQMSSSKGVRSTSKSTSNRTTTKTVTVSGGRSDDFEHLGLTFQPLDTSTQRERINVSRSGTMGVRRPPTRRHTPVTVTPAPIVSTSPDDSEVEIKDEVIVDSDDNLRTTPPPPHHHRSSMMNKDFISSQRSSNEMHHTHHQRSSSGGGLSIVEFKDITPKFRGVMVGFPVEIQIELQNRLRSGSNMGRNNNGADSDEDEDRNKPYQSALIHSNEMVERQQQNKQKKIEGDDIYSPQSRLLFGSPSSSSPTPPQDNTNKGSTFDFHQRKKSYELESFDSHAESRPLRTFSNKNNNKYTANYLNLFPPSDDDLRREDNVKLDRRRHSPTPSPISSPTWDKFYNKVEKESQLFYDKSTNISNRPYLSPFDEEEQKFQKSTEIPIQREQDFTLKHNTEFESRSSKFFGQDNYMVTPSRLMNFSSNEVPMSPPPDISQSPNYFESGSPTTTPTTPSSLPPSLERSRRLLQMLDETPSVLSKMSLNTYPPPEPDRHNKWLNNNNDDDDEKEEEWQTQRQLSFLNDSLSRILEAGLTTSGGNLSHGNANTHTSGNAGLDKFSSMLGDNNNLYTTTSSYSSKFEDSEMIDINGNVQANYPGQISQTWISSGDMNKPSQKVRDKDVITSISATHDHLKRGAKKVEFCKTEVHFTADSGKFHIVETDENKPSTSHLFRRKKKDRTKISGVGDVEIATSMESSTNNSSTLQKSGEELGSGGGFSNEHTADAELLTTPTIRDIESKSTPTTTSDQSDKIYSSSFFNLKSEPLPEISHIVEIQPNNGNRLSRLNPIGEGGESPSHNIFSNYEEMKIQRYLNHLKLPSSMPTSQTESSKQILNFNLDDGQPNTYRFNNVLYENGSFVPLATRRSLIEMNNNNKKGGGLSESDNRSSVSITPENPAPFQQPIRLTRMEARVATARPNPQITSVELRYEFDNEGNSDRSGGGGGGTSPFVSQYEKMQQQKTKESRRSVLSDFENRAQNNSYAKPETYSSRSERISDLIKRSYYKNPDLDWTPGDSESGGDNNNNNNKRLNDLAMSTATISSTSNNKSASKSIVTIGEYDITRSNSVNKQNTEASPESQPILCLDHTWKGPAYLGGGNNNADSGKSSARSLTLLQLGPSEPEWISKARNREHRIRDWESVGKQQTYSAPSQPEQPPWVDDFIRPRAKTVLAERVVPKVSVVYPWQRHPVTGGRDEDNIRESSQIEEDDDEEHKSHIVSIVPTPSFLSGKHGNILHTSRGPKSLPDLPVLELSTKNQDIVDRDSDSILINSSTHVMKSSRRGEGTRRESRGLPDSPTLSSPPPPSRTSHNQATTISNSEQTSTNRSGHHHKSAGPPSGEIIHPKKKDKSSHAIVKPLNDSTVTANLNIENKDVRKSGSRSGRSTTTTDLKSVTSTNSTKDRTSVSSGKRTIVGKDSSTVSNSTTPTIHRHPLVKVSKLPVRKNLPQRGEGKAVKGGSKSKENPDESEKSTLDKKRSGTITITRGGRGGGLLTNVETTKMTMTNNKNNKSENVNKIPQQQQPWRRK